jgi:vesicle-fusing ATPase
VDALNNILIIGMTNRKDMIDEAILRPGRLEIHIEITLPNEEGRMQILNIKTAEMRKSKRLAEEVVQRLPELGQRTKNFTGAELEGLVRNAASFALSRNIDASNIKALDTSAIKVEWNDFERALGETFPAFGNKDSQELLSYFSNGLCSYGPAFEDTWGTLQRLVKQTRNSERTPLLSVLLEGAVSSGKTAIAAKLAAESDFPFIRMISATTMIGFSESRRCSTLLKVFTDSYKSPVSIIFIDDIERIIEFTPVGNRFSNSVLQTLLLLLRKVPPAPARLMVVASSSISHLLEDLQLTQAFNITLHVSLLQSAQEYRAVMNEYAPDLGAKVVSDIAAALNDKAIAIKQFLVILEMVRSDKPADEITVEDFLACLQQVGF